MATKQKIEIEVCERTKNNMTPIPVFIIECVGGETLGNYYTSTSYRVKSLNRVLSEEDLDKLWNMGFFGYGQGFKIIRKENEALDKCNEYTVVNVYVTRDSSD